MNSIKRKIFYSFHYGNDVMRVQQVRNMGVVEGNEPVTANAWEEVKRKGDASIKKWIDDTLQGKSCAIVLIGEETYKRPWVLHEIQRAWEMGKGLFGIHIHNLKCPNNGTCSKGKNPFELFTFKHAGQVVTPRVYDPIFWDAYGEISQNLSAWIEKAIAQRN
jgi:hypothetical protein